MFTITHTDAQVGLNLNEQLKLSFTSHTFTLKPTWSLTLTVTHALTHHSLYKK